MEYIESMIQVNCLNKLYSKLKKFVISASSDILAKSFTIFTSTFVKLLNNSVGKAFPKTEIQFFKNVRGLKIFSTFIIDVE